MSIALTLAYTALFVWLIHRCKYFRIEGLNPKCAYLGFAAKVFFGFIFYLVYTYIYTDPTTADMYRYYADGRVMFSAFEHHRYLDYFRMLFGIANDTNYFTVHYYDVMNYWFRSEFRIVSDTHLIIRFNAATMLLSGGHLSVHVLIMAFLSFAGSVGICNFLSRHTKQPRALLFFITFFVPTVAFWSSGVMKEGLITCGMGIALHSTERLLATKQWRHLPLLILSLLMIVYTKFYIMAVFLPFTLIFFAVNKTLAPTRLATPYYLAGVCFLAVIPVCIYLFRNINPIDLLLERKAHFEVLAQASAAQSRITIPSLNHNPLSLLAAIPSALINSIFRPWLGDAICGSSPWFLMLPMALESLALIAFATLAILFPRRQNPLKNNMLNYCLFLSLPIFLLIGLTIPILGAIVRYRSLLLVFLLTAIGECIDWERLARKFPHKWKPIHLKIKKVKHIRIISVEKPLK